MRLIWAIRGRQEREMKEVTVNFLSIYLVELGLAPECGSGRDLLDRLCLVARSRNMRGGLLAGLPSCPSITFPGGTCVELSLDNSFSFLSQFPTPFFPPLFCVTSWQVRPLKCHFFQENLLLEDLPPSPLPAWLLRKMRQSLDVVLPVYSHQWHFHPFQSCLILETDCSSPKPQRWSLNFLKAKCVPDFNPKPLSLTTFLSSSPAVSSLPDFSFCFTFLGSLSWILNPMGLSLTWMSLLARDLDFPSDQAFLPSFIKLIWSSWGGVCWAVLMRREQCCDLQGRSWDNSLTVCVGGECWVAGESEVEEE